MSQMTRLILIAMAVGGLAVAPTVRAQSAAELEAQIAQLQQRIAQLEAENAELRRQLGVAEQDKADLAAEREQLEKLAGVTAKGEQVESAVALVQSSYDEQTGRTTVRFKPRKADTTGSGPLSADHYVTAAYSYPGRSVEPGSAGDVDLLIYTFMHPTNAYESLSEVDLIVDGESSLTLPVAGYEVRKTRKPRPSARGSQPDRYDELLRLTLDEQTLRTLAGANEVILKLSGNDLILGRSHLAMFAAARERISRGM